jgi:gluconolactonase
MDMAEEIVVLATAKQPKPRELDISQIVDPCAEWEKVAEVKRPYLEGINFDREGRIWLVSPRTGEIMRIENGKPITVGPTGDTPCGMAFHKDGRLFVVGKAGKLFWVDTESGDRHLIADRYQMGHFTGLNDCTFDSEGGFYFTEPYGSNVWNATGNVYYLPPDGNEDDIVKIMSNIAFPNGICCAPDDERLYVAEFAKNRIISAQCYHPKEKNEPANVFSTYIGGVGPDGICCDSEGNVYCAHNPAGEVSVVNKDGFHYGSIRLPEEVGHHSSNLAFNGNYLYVEESVSSTIWRIQLKKSGLKLYGNM